MPAAAALRHEAASLLPGQIIFREGEPCGRLALVHSGMVRLFQTLSGGRGRSSASPCP